MTTVGTKERRTPEIAQPTLIPPSARQVLSKDGTATAFDRIGAGTGCDSDRRRALLPRPGPEWEAG